MNQIDQRIKYLIEEFHNKIISPEEKEKIRRKLLGALDEKEKEYILKREVIKV